MKKIEFISGLKNLLAENKLNDVFEILNEVRTQFNHQLDNSIVINSKRYSLNITNKVNKIISEEEFYIEENKITQSILEGIIPGIENESIESLKFNSLNKLLRYFPNSNLLPKTVKSRKRNLYLAAFSLITVICTCIIGFHSLAKEDLTIENLKTQLEDFEFDSVETVNLLEGQRILNHLGILDSRIEKYPNVVVGRYNKKYEIAIWIGTYQKLDTYGIRFGSPEREYFGNNKSYFEVKKK